MMWRDDPRLTQHTQSLAHFNSLHSQIGDALMPKVRMGRVKGQLCELDLAIGYLSR